jgi:hypothetical protein
MFRIESKMTEPLLAIPLLLPLSVSAGELDGKAIICEKEAMKGFPRTGVVDGYRWLPSGRCELSNKS